MRQRFWMICLFFGTLALLPGSLQMQPRAAAAATAMGLQEDFIRVAEQVMPSVVSLKAVKVVTYQPRGVPEDFFRGTPL